MSVRRAVIIVVVILGLLVVADRVAVLAADKVVANKIENDQGLAQQPRVAIHGFPFLTQAIGGRYDNVTLTLHDLRNTTVAVQTLSVDLRGVHVPIGAVVSQRLSRVPIDRANASLVVAFADINHFLADKHLSVEKGSDDEITVRGRATVLGKTVTVSGSGKVEVRDSDLVITVGHGLDVTIPLGGLPFRISLISAKATNAGIVVQATASGLVVHPRT